MKLYRLPQMIKACNHARMQHKITPRRCALLIDTKRQNQTQIKLFSVADVPVGMNGWRDEKRPNRLCVLYDYMNRKRKSGDAIIKMHKQ